MFSIKTSNIEYVQKFNISVNNAIASWDTARAFEKKCLLDSDEENINFLQVLDNFAVGR